MAKIGLFYGSTTGNVLKVAELIQKAFDPGQVELVDVGRASPNDLKSWQARKSPSLVWGTRDYMPTILSTA
jgi:flavodoxin